MVLSVQASKPNIIFVLVDDWGIADVGFPAFRNPDIKTPNFDMLAKTGVILNRHYVYKYCSPSRASLLMTGRYGLIMSTMKWNPKPEDTLGLNLNMTALPWSKAGYSTHMVGK